MNLEHKNNEKICVTPFKDDPKRANVENFYLLKSAKFLTISRPLLVCFCRFRPKCWKRTLLNEFEAKVKEHSPTIVSL